MPEEPGELAGDSGRDDRATLPVGVEPLPGAYAGVAALAMRDHGAGCPLGGGEASVPAPARGGSATRPR